MKSIVFLILAVFFGTTIFSQKEVLLSPNLRQATVFFTGVQLQHENQVSLKPGKQEVVLQKLTDFLDPNTVQVKASGDLTILAVRTRKNFEDLRINNDDIKAINAKKKILEIQHNNLIDEYTILELDRNLIMQNRNLKGNDQGIKMIELKEAYTFMHTKITEITTRQTAIYDLLEDIEKKKNLLEQEIISQRSKPVINYTEIIIEIDVHKATEANFIVNYISPRATWKPYYDMRSEGIGKPVRLEAKANVSQTTGIEWKEIDLILSTNDPYQNATQANIEPWYISYNNYPTAHTITSRNIPQVDYSGETLRGEIIDASTGESLAFTKITFPGFLGGTVSNEDGKFEVVIPKDAKIALASFVGYSDVQLTIDAPYLKFFMKPNELNLEEVTVSVNQSINGALSYNNVPTVSYMGTYTLNDSDVMVSEDDKAMEWKSTGKTRFRRSSAPMMDELSKSENKKVWAPTVTTFAEKKDIRVEYRILSKMSIPTDGMDHRVNIASYDLPAKYEYHCIPKIDPSVYLSAQVNGWEKLNLLSGSSNIYFDGTFMGSSYLDVNTTKDTLSFSFGKDSKMVVERTKIKERNKTKTMGSRQKSDIAWEIKIKNNGAAIIPVMIMDQFPLTANADIKIKNGELIEGKVNDKTGIITWEFIQGISGSKSVFFDYSIDAQYGIPLYLE